MNINKQDDLNYLSTTILWIFVLLILVVGIGMITQLYFVGNKILNLNARVDYIEDAISPCMINA